MKCIILLLICFQLNAQPPTPPGFKVRVALPTKNNTVNVTHQVTTETEVYMITYHSFSVGTNTFKVAVSTNHIGKYLNWSVPAKQ